MKNETCPLGGGGVNRGMQIRWSVVFLGPIRRSDLIFVQIRIRVTLKTDRIRKPGQNFQLTRDPRYFLNPRIRSIYRRNPQSVSFLRSNPPIRGPIHPPPITVSISSDGWRDRSLDQANWRRKWPTTLPIALRFVLAVTGRRWKLAGVDTLYHSCYWSKFIVTIQLMSIKLEWRMIIAVNFPI